MPKIGLISNPQSQRNRRGLDEIGAAVAGMPDVIHIATDGREVLDEVLSELARQEVGVLLISGGDGTVQTVLTRLFEGRSFERMPYLAILPRGMANTTAADVGLRGKAAAALARLIAASRDGTLAEHVVERRILRIENLQGGMPQRGMMFGAGAITDAIEFCCREIYARGLKGKAWHERRARRTALGRRSGPPWQRRTAQPCHRGGARWRSGEPGRSAPGAGHHARSPDALVPTVLELRRPADSLHRHRLSA